jgi:hypothetical protein
MEGCENNQSSYCLNSWCYVDSDLCPIVRSNCLQAGGVIGAGDVSPYCRSRDSRLSILIQPHRYSYATCGNINAYDGNGLNKIVANTLVKLAVSAWAPWLVNRGPEEYGGPLYDIVIDVMKEYQPEPRLNLIHTWATEQSRAVFPASSYTACVHDVAVGNFDICVADLWRTAERSKISHFTPALKYDHFYLVTRKQMVEDSIWVMLGRPFLPFSQAAWCAVVGYIIGMSVILWMMKMHAQGRQQFQAGGNKVSTLSKWGLKEMCSTLFDMWHNFLQGSSIEAGDGAEGETGAHRIFRIAFAFFVLVILASYTASLASMLVTEKRMKAKIPNIEAAVTQGITVCLPSALVPPMEKVYPQGKFVDAKYVEWMPRSMYSGMCGAGLFTQGAIDYMHAGNIQEDDCNAVNGGSCYHCEGSLSPEEAHCEQGFEGRKRQDCDFIRTGEIVFTVPVAFPISARLQQSVSWGITKKLMDGSWEDIKRKNKPEFPVSKCESLMDDEEEEGLKLKDLSGTLFISVGLAVLGKLAFVLEALLKKMFAKDGRTTRELAQKMERCTATHSHVVTFDDSQTGDATGRVAPSMGETIHSQDVCCIRTSTGESSPTASEGMLSPNIGGGKMSSQPEMLTNDFSGVTPIAAWQS